MATGTGTSTDILNWLYDAFEEKEQFGNWADLKPLLAQMRAGGIDVPVGRLHRVLREGVTGEKKPSGGRNSLVLRKAHTGWCWARRR